MTFEFASRWAEAADEIRPSTIAAYRRMLEVVYPTIGGIRLNKLRPMALENMLSRTAQAQAPTEGSVNEPPRSRTSPWSPPCSATPKRKRDHRENPARMLDLPTPRRAYSASPREARRRSCWTRWQWNRGTTDSFICSPCTPAAAGASCAAPLQWSDFTTTQNGLLTVSRSHQQCPRSKSIG